MLHMESNNKTAVAYSRPFLNYNRHFKFGVIYIYIPYIYIYIYIHIHIILCRKLNHDKMYVM